jgi:hypothetical protein
MVCFHFFFFFFSKHTVGNDRSSYITSTPTVVDLDGDGMLEIVASTNLGFVYVIDHNGSKFGR